MKRRATRFAAALACLSALVLPTRAAQALVPVGEVIGLQLHDDTVTIVAFDDSLSAAAREAGLKIGDEIVAIDGASIDTAEDVRRSLECCDGHIEMTIRRGSRERELTLIPARTPDGPKLGVYLRQGIAGIGTVTWYDPATGRFGTLGHGVSDARGTLLRLSQGNAAFARVLSVQKGRSGNPGQLKGETRETGLCGSLLRNTPQGVFGVSSQGWQGHAVPVAAWEEIVPGAVTIRSTVEGSSPREYSAEILRIYPRDRSDGRNFLLKVTDPDLLAATGGIVQGMSGSPIIQDGKLVGAVTHVLVNDPTRGYGIFIENMLDAAG